MSTQVLPEPLQAFAQILMAKKVMSEDEAQKSLEACKERFEQPGSGLGIELGTAISRVDKMLSAMDFGVRSMKATGPDGMIFHCFVNKTADEIAKLHGSKLADWQIKVFRGIIEKIGSSYEEQVVLMELQELATHITTGETESSKKEMIKSFADQLVEDYWLSRPGNDVHYRLGVRSYVELPELLKSFQLEVPQVIYH